MNAIATLKTSRSILIVEDEEIIRTTLREFLTGEGYVVADAATVGDALGLARQRDSTSPSATCSFPTATGSPSCAGCSSSTLKRPCW